MIVQQVDLPRAERVGGILFCDKLPYPTDYVKHDLFLVVFVPNDEAAVARARMAMELLISQGRLLEGNVRLRMATDEYDFNGLVEHFLIESVPTKAIPA